jgi:hypothetical protein
MTGGDTSTASGGCPATTDTATDGTAGTATTGPYAWKSVTIRGGGFVDGIVFSPVQKDLIYTRTDVGGAYRWDAPMNGWVPITDWVSHGNSNQLGIESIAADPVDANIVYLAAGMYITSGIGVILRSTDRGTTFTTNTIGVPMGGNVDGRSMGERLAIDPNQTSTLYFGSRNNGLMKSTDSGTNWSQVASFPVLGVLDRGLSFVTFDPRSGTQGSGSSTIYVGAADIAATSNLYVSKDSGSTWQVVPGGPSGQMPHHGVLNSAGFLYLAYNYGATAANYGAGPNNITAGGIWKFNTSTGEWSDVTPNRGSFGYGGVSVDRNNPDRVVVSTLDWWNPDEIYLTSNAGTNWTAIGRSAKHNLKGAEWLRWGQPGCPSVNSAGWAGDVEIDPFNSDHVMYITGQGVWGTNNASSATVSDVEWSFEDRNLEETVVTDIVPSVHGAFLSCVGDIGGTRNESLDHPSATGMYSNPVSVSCSSLDFAAQNPDIVVRAGSANSANANKIGGYSKNNGQTWTPFAALPTGAVVPTGAGGKLAVSADGTSIVWGVRSIIPPATTASTAFANSVDFGATWTSITGLPSGSSIAADRKNPSKFYAYAYAGGVGTVYVSTDAGKTFAAAPNTVTFAGRGVLRAVFGIEGDLWIPASTALYHSTESGANFAAVANVQNAYAVGFGMQAPGKTYPAVYLVGNVNDVYGIYRSDDAGATWTVISDAEHQFGWATYIAGDETIYGQVYVGTGGRGIIYGLPGQP